MLGNDIVDLQLAATQSNWRRKGYLQKIFTEQEQDLIANATNQDQMVWLLWSMKEAAYKIVNIEIGERFYRPKSFECIPNFSEHPIIGKATYEDFELDTVSELNENFVNTTATSEQNRKLEHYLLNNPNTYIEDFNKNSFQFRLVKNEANLPTIQDILTEEYGPASVSHHGRYVAIVHPSQFEPV
ncbi:MAG: 4'-phosphopantetheinyl transferase superfamily protein [Bacteroidota bacterium]